MPEQKRKFCFLASDDEEAFHVVRSLKEEYGNVAAKDADVVVVLGGDGFMLECLHKHADVKAAFFGINYGTYGFLLNLQKDVPLHERIDAAQEINLHPLRMEATTNSGEKIIARAYNEVALTRETRQSAKLNIKVNGREQLPLLICDGALVATPAGSTAYNLSAHGPILPLSSDAIALTPISAFRPRRWPGAILPTETKIEFSVLEPEKRPVYAVADYTEVKDVKSVSVYLDKDITRTLLFDPEHNLEERIIREQFAV